MLTKQTSKKISFRQAKYTVLVAFLLGISFSSWQLYIDLNDEKKRLDETMQQILSISKESAVQAAINLDKKLSKQIAKGLFQFSPIYKVKLIDNYGETLALIERYNPTLNLSHKWLVNFILEPSKTYSVDLFYPDSLELMGKMIVDVDIHSFTKTFFDRVLRVFLSELVHIFILAFVLFILFHYVLTRPLLNIITAFSGITPGDKNNAIKHIHRDDELGVLVHTINDLLNRFNNSLEKQKQTEDSLRDSEAQVRLLLNSMAEGMYGLDLDGNCTFVNNSLLNILGYNNADELIGKEMHPLIHHSYPDGTTLPIEKCRIHKTSLSGKGVHADDEILWRADGTCFPVEYSAYPIMRDNKNIGAVVTFLDISLRKQAENDLAAEQEHLAVTLRSIGDGVITTDTAGNIILLNRVAERLTGWSSEEANGMALQDVFKIINQQTGEPNENPMGKILRTGQIVGLAHHTVLQAKDGTQRNIANSGAPILDKNQQTVGVVLVFRDISTQLEAKIERQALVKQLEQSRKIEALTTFAAGAAHELATPLSTIAIASGEILHDILNNCSDEEELHDDISLIRDQVERCKYILKQMAANAGQEVGEKVISFSIKKLVDDILILFSPDTFDQIAVDIQVANQSIVMPLHSLSRVIRGLLRNGIEASENGKTIFLSCYENATYLFFEIRDQGKGMDEETLKRAIDPFFTTKPPGHNLGLGLYLAQSLASQFGGDLQIASSPLQGTAITIRFAKDFVYA